MSIDPILFPMAAKAEAEYTPPKYDGQTLLGHPLSIFVTLPDGSQCDLSGALEFTPGARGIQANINKVIDLIGT